MSKFEQLDNQNMKNLYNAILSLENQDECRRFFEDICTVNELISICQRFEVAVMLRHSKTYTEIAKETHASTATISRVNRTLNYGNDGYDLVIERMRDQDRARLKGRSKRSLDD